MTDAQRKLVCVALVAVGLVLAFLTLHAGTGGYLGNRPILVLFEYPDPKTPFLIEQWGIFTATYVKKVPAVLLGIVVPLCLFAAAAYAKLSDPAKQRDGSLELPQGSTAHPVAPPSLMGSNDQRTLLPTG
jgi:hypothetical protein